MSPLLQATVYPLGAGLAMVVGAALARVERIQPKWLEEELRHGIIAFGGGALLSAVALVLVPDGQKHLTPLWVALWFLLGGVLLMGLDMFLAKHQTPLSNLVAMLSDFVPEAIALGAALSNPGGKGLLLALLIALQNLPEGFNAYREMAASGSFSPRKVIGSLLGLATLGPLAGVAGYLLLSDQPEVVGGISLAAAGGILYLVMQDIAPQAKLKRHWLPPLGGVLGFLLGLIGQMLTG